jgi:HSP90 family molecular chaperone
MSTLQELQQSDPTKYQQVTQQIAANLKSAAATATADGNTSAATQLNTLATDFTNASQSGQLPDVLDLAKAIGGGHHHHHSASSESASGSNSTTTTSGTGSSSDISELLSQLQAAFQSNSTQTDSLDPMAIIFGTLSSSGVSASASS